MQMISINNMIFTPLHGIQCLQVNVFRLATTYKTSTGSNAQHPTLYPARTCYFMCTVLGVFVVSYVYLSYYYVYLSYLMCIFCTSYVYLLYLMCICCTMCVLLFLLKMPDSWLEVSIRKVLRPATSTQVFLGFPVSTSEC
jgi:hypothetical protein